MVNYFSPSLIVYSVLIDALLVFVQVPKFLNHHFRYSTSIFQKIGFSSVSPQQSDDDVNELKDHERALDGSSEDCPSGSENTSEPCLQY